MTAAEIAVGLNARHAGAVYTAECPACGYKGALSIRDSDDRTFIRCHAGCEQSAVINALRLRGLWHGRADAWQSYRPVVQPARDRAPTDAQKVEWARELWRRSLPAAGT